MVMAVYSQLGRLLAARDVALDSLRAELLARYSLDIDIHSLETLAREGRLQQPNIELVAAIAAILEVRLDDLLDARDVWDEADASPESQQQTDARADLSPADERRLNHLLYLRDWGDDPLTKEDERELEALTAPVARALIDGDISIFAASKGISFAEARAQVEAAAEDAAAYWSALVADPSLMAAEVAKTKTR